VITKLASVVVALVSAVGLGVLTGVVVADQAHIGPRGSLGSVGAQGAPGAQGLIGSAGPVGFRGPSGISRVVLGQQYLRVAKVVNDQLAKANALFGSTGGAQSVSFARAKQVLDAYAKTNYEFAENVRKLFSVVSYYQGPEWSQVRLAVDALIQRVLADQGSIATIQSQTTTTDLQIEWNSWVTTPASASASEARAVRSLLNLPDVPIT
jgi:hypothetical protein